MITINTDIDRLPNVLRNYYDQVPFAQAGALNDSVFQIRKDSIDSEFGGGVDLRRKVHARRTTLANKADKYSLRAELGTTQWYMETLSEGGRRRAAKGVKVGGVKYLWIPGRKWRKANGGIKKIPDGKRFSIVTKKGVRLYMVRTKKDTKRKVGTVSLGVLVSETEYKGMIDWEAVTTDDFQKLFTRAFKKRMVRAARTAR